MRRRLEVRPNPRPDMIEVRACRGGSVGITLLNYIGRNLEYLTPTQARDLAALLINAAKEAEEAAKTTCAPGVTEG